ncbi:DUF5309 domain-containing protein [Campylobacter concisus]|uniref:SU10 major capsid protein n=2 Tax=Campylobacter concisus TaxID=199 RepID=UPI0018845E31|nr:DUF5309 family protein [Campylobacter concisus]MBE9835854.1 DUF5309 domain-containing protein [Campylobacter concisus]
MAITTTGFQAPATKREGLKPSVYENIILIGADETPILKLIGTSSVKGIEHSSLTDSLAAPKKNAQLEISDFDDQIKSSVQKTSNAVQIFTSNVSVSRSMQAVATYGGKELERETAKRAKEHKLDMEYAIFGLGRDADVKKSVFKAPTVRTGEMAGLFYFLAKDSAAFASGKRGNVVAFDSTGDWKGTPAALTETVLSQLLQNIWDAGTTPKDVFIGAELKLAINKIVFRYHSRSQIIILILKFIAERLIFGITKAIISILLENFV